MLRGEHWPLHRRLFEPAGTIDVRRREHRGGPQSGGEGPTTPPEPRSDQCARDDCEAASAVDQRLGARDAPNLSRRPDPCVGHAAQGAAALAGDFGQRLHDPIHHHHVRQRHRFVGCLGAGGLDEAVGDLRLSEGVGASSGDRRRPRGWHRMRDDRFGERQLVPARQPRTTWAVRGFADTEGFEVALDPTLSHGGGQTRHEGVCCTAGRERVLHAAW